MDKKDKEHVRKKNTEVIHPDLDDWKELDILVTKSKTEESHKEVEKPSGEDVLSLGVIDLSMTAIFLSRHWPGPLGSIQLSTAVIYF